MKRKKPAVPAVPVQKAVPPENPPPAASSGRFDRAFVIGFSVLLFLTMTVQTKAVALVMAGLAVLSLIGRGPLSNFRRRMSVPVLGLLLFALAGGCAGLYSNFGNYALMEYIKLLTSFSLAVILLARGQKRHIPGLLWGVAAVSSAFALISIDAACVSVLFDGFRLLASALGDTSYETLTGMASAARINGVYNDANVTASIFALGILLALHLLSNREKRGEKATAAVLLGIQSMAFFLSLSRGAILCFAGALLVYLAACGKDQRIRLFLLMVETAVVTVALSFPSIRFIGTSSVLPVLLAVAAGAVIFAVDWAVGQRVARKLAGHGKAMIGVFAGVLLACAAYVVIAFQVTGPLAIAEAGQVERTLSLSPGEYTVSGEWDGDVTLTVNTQTQQEVLTNMRTQAYRGTIEGAGFTVPEGTMTVQFLFGSQSGAEIRAVRLSDGTELALNYPMLPSFITTRLQSDLFADYSFYLRVQFMKDAWTLFSQSPLLGYGFGSTEGMYTAVQPFFYESLYVHNHILQVMDDMGLLGLIPFLMLLLGTAYLLIRRLRETRDPLAAALLACWAMMNLHGLMEINFSIRAYQCVVYPLLMLVVLLYGKEQQGKAGKIGGTLSFFGTGIYLLTFGVLLACNMIAAQISSAAAENPNVTRSEFMTVSARADALDAYEDQSYKVNLMGNALQSGGISNEGIAARCARELRATGEYDSCYYVAAYYYLPLGRLDDFFDTLLEGLQQERSNPEAWNSAMNLCVQAFDQIYPEEVDTFAEGVRKIGAAMDETNGQLLIPVTLTEVNAGLLSCVRTESLSGEELYAAISELLS